jgi:hypothetical protein
MKLKIGFDFHGVLDISALTDKETDHPEVFRTLANDLIKAGYEIHIITGEENTPDFRNNLKYLGVNYTKIFSITSYHKRKGIAIKYDKNGEPWIDKDLWNRTKADYCRRNKIDLHIDDSAIYGKYFTTPFLLLCKGKKE